MIRLPSFRVMTDSCPGTLEKSYDGYVDLREGDLLLFLGYNKRRMLYRVLAKGEIVVFSDDALLTLTEAVKL